MARALCTPKAACEILALLLVLSFQTAEAQSAVPGWGIALLVLVAVILLLLLMLCCSMMICRRKDSCESSQSGVSSYFPHLGFSRQDC
ncbi:mucin-1-like [Microcaecilia unicolor]|uniref:Mucin-1-like n=1 Tax=Microcaecilia unicolor TaxID=1415580 RepID=A0A6P7XL77_9AMPH|nr:mucin-1-like [Microcaecilia unicolor]